MSRQEDNSGYARTIPYDLGGISPDEEIHRVIQIELNPYLKTEFTPQRQNAVHRHVVRELTGAL